MTKCVGIVKDPKKYNKELYKILSELMLNGIRCGCIDTLACETCGSLIRDSICLCMGIFDCPVCGKTNNTKELYND